MAHQLMLHGHPVGYLPPTYASEILTSGGNTVQEVLDDIVVSGSNANGSYIKFADGTMICTKRVNYSGAINTATGALYESANIDLGDFPQTFYAIPYVSLSTSIYGFCSGARSTSLGSVGLANIFRTTSLSSTTGYIDVIAIGRWKA